MSAPFKEDEIPTTRDREIESSVARWASRNEKRKLTAFSESSRINPEQFSHLNRVVGSGRARALAGTPEGSDLVRESFTFDDLTRELSRAPKLDQALQYDPDLQIVAAPDISTLASLEEALRGGVRNTALIAGQVGAGVDDAIIAVRGFDELHSKLLGLDPPSAAQASELLLAQFRQKSAALKLEAADLGEVGTAFATIARASPQLAAGFTAFLGGTAVGGPLLGRALTAAQSYVFESGSVYNEWTYGPDPMDEDLVAVFAPAYGVFASVIETIAIGKQSAPIKHALKQAIKAASKKDAIKILMGNFTMELFRNALIEGGEETVQQAGQVFFSALLRHPGDPEGFVDDLMSEETLGQLLKAFKGGATVGVAVGGVRTGIGTVVDLKTARRDAEQEKQFGQDLAEGVSKAEMLDHSPAKFKNLLFQMTEGTPQEDVWIDADTFLDHFSKPENAQALDDLRKAIPDIDEQILEAQNTGSDIVMKTADFATHIAATQHLDGLSDGLRFNPDAPTLAALNQEATERETEALEAEIEREAGTLETDELIEVSESAVTTLTDRAVDDLGLTRREAEAFATVKVANLMTLAQTENLDPAAFVNAAMGRLPLQKREDVPSPEEFAQLQEGVEPLAQPTKEKELPRGFFARFEGGGGLLALTSKANKSTVFHELSHDMFSVMQALAQRSEASPDLQADWALLRDWLGANDEDALTDAQEEVLAETMEVYFEEGNAPTPELQSVFDRISRWMSETYRRVRGRPNADINDDVRAVFERMFATQEAIEAAKADLGFQDVFEGRKPEGMTDAAWERAQARVRNVESEINERAGRKVLKAKLKEVNAAATEVRNSVRKTVTQQLWDDPAYRARSWLRTGKLPDGSELPAEHSRLSWNGILEVLSDLPETEQQERLASLKLMRLTKKDGMDPGVAAQALGLDDATEMLDLMEGIKDQTLTQAIKAETEKQMQEQHPELLVSQEELKAQAEAAILDVDSRVKHMEQTIKALRKLDAESPGRAAAERAAVTTPLGVQEAERRLEVAQRTLEDATRREDVQRGLLTSLALDVRQAEERLRIERRRARRERMAATEATRAERARGREALREQREGLRGAAAEALSEERRQSAARLSEIRQGAALATQGLNVGAIRVAAAARVESTSGRKLKSLVANFRIVSQKKSKEAVRTAGRGDYGESADALETVVLANEIVRRGNEAMIRRDKGQRKLVPMTRAKFQGPKLSKKQNPNQDSRFIWAHTFNLLDRYELRKTTKDVRAVPEPRDTGGENFQDFRDRYGESMGELWAGPDFFDSGDFRKHYLDMTVQEFDDLVDGITNITRWANRMTANAKGEEAQDFQSALNDMIASAKAFRTGQSPDTPEGAESIWEQGLKFKNATYSAIARPEFAFDRLDGFDIHGPYNTNMLRPLQERVNFEMEHKAEREEQQNKAFQAAYLNIPLDATIGERLKSSADYQFTVRRFMRKRLAGADAIAGTHLTRNNLIQIMLYYGSPEGRKALAESDTHPISDEQFLSLVGKYATKEDFDYVESIWALPEQDWQAVKELNENLTGISPPKVKALPYATPQGRVLSGGYSRLFYDPRRSKAHVRIAEAKATVESFFGTGSRRAQTDSGHRQARKGSAGQQLVWSHTTVWNMQLNRSAADLAYAEVIPQIMRFMNNDQWRRAVADALGDNFMNHLRGWVQHTVSPVFQPTTGMEKMIDRARKGGIVQALGGNLTTNIIQTTGLLTALPRLGRYSFVGLRSLFQSGWAHGVTRPESGGGAHHMVKAIDEMMQLSPDLRFRQQTYNANAAEFLSRGTFPTNISLQATQTTLATIGYIDAIIAASVWAGAYHQAMDGAPISLSQGVRKGNHDDAVIYANKLMKKTQASGQRIDLAKFMSTNAPLWRSIFAFQTFMNNLLNLTIEETDLVVQGGSKWRYASYIALIYVIMPQLEEMMRDEVKDWQPDSEPDEDEFGLFTIPIAALSSLAAGFPIAGDFVWGVESVVKGKGFGRDFDIGPAGRAWLQTVKATAGPFQLAAGDISIEEAIEEAVHAGGYWLPFPTEKVLKGAELITQTQLTD